MDKRKFRRIILALGFSAIIIFMTYISFVKKDDWFRSEAEIKFHDGCIEKYVDSILVTPECTKARKQIEDKNARYNYTDSWKININLTET